MGTLSLPPPPPPPPLPPPPLVSSAAPPPRVAVGRVEGAVAMEEFMPKRASTRVKKGRLIWEYSYTWLKRVFQRSRVRTRRNEVKRSEVKWRGKIEQIVE